MARVTLTQLAKKAAAEPDFWKRLRADPVAALNERKLQVRATDLQRLKRALKRKRFDIVVRVDAARLARSIPVPPGCEGPWTQSDPDWMSWEDFP